MVGVPTLLSTSYTRRMHVKAVIFDWAGVIAADGYWAWLHKNVPSARENKATFQELSEQVDSARISHDDFMQRLSQESGKPVDQIWDEVKREIVIDENLVAFIRELKQKYKIGLLSNFTHAWLSEILTENNLWDLFDHNVISSEHGIIKPEPEIFHKMLDLLEVAPGEAVFIDDRQYNVDGANAVGIKGLLYTDLETLKKDLNEIGAIRVGF